MRKFAWIAVVIIVMGCFSVAFAWAQSSGSRGGMAAQGAPVAPNLDRQTVQEFITIESSAEVRVAPTEIRVVLAVTGEGETAQACQSAVQGTIAELKQDWAGIGIPDENIVVDFIAVLPRYDWQIETQDGRQAAVEHKVGYRMQTNIHLAVKQEALAQQALGFAFGRGVTDIIAFDYWSHDLDAVKVEARKQAVAAAKAKSELLVGGLFDTKPQIINVQEVTDVRYPESLYESFERSDEQGITIPYRANDIPQIRAFRPKNTYYRGLYTNGDVQSSELPMKPEISVVSTVRLYYESPAAALARAEKAKEKTVPVSAQD